METREEVMFGELHDRRVDRLRDMDVRELLKLCPENYEFTWTIGVLVNCKEKVIQEEKSE